MSLVRKAKFAQKTLSFSALTQAENNLFSLIFIIFLHSAQQTQ